MAGSFASLIGLAIFVPFVAAFWVGILGLKRCGTNGIWWTMATGIALATIGMLGYITGIFIAMGGGLRNQPGSWIQIALLLGALIPVGSLVFAAGFALHGLKAGRARDRQDELEQLTAAMSEEINQLRGSDSTP